ncbi:hypothetical protein N836_36090 [Leptolyngbya sp. Heron Island J]|uniref:hypothetical protein n=1 Tax=Leptolyngbya sp. Heron Island J TaxID=1385935 RepID=UPI0003B945F1|nr:hypothetical protein [Leptolyngbya sp. Heron Island J]ESA37590.1 hypothetical protein N836_36090 [Leptolyngbya sp. Heron Island J]
MATDGEKFEQMVWAGAEIAIAIARSFLGEYPYQVLSQHPRAQGFLRYSLFLLQPSQWFLKTPSAENYATHQKSLSGG